MKLTNIIALLVFFVIFSSCNVGGDYNKELSGGYFYRNEGEDINDILCKKSEGGEIPANVIAFDYNSNFIIAKQKPKIPQEPLYSKKYSYDNGVDTVYYWIIVNKERLVLGPLSYESFDALRIKFNVSKELAFK